MGLCVASRVSFGHSSIVSYTCLFHCRVLVKLYFTDMEEGAGGETVFPRAWPPGLPEEERLSTEEAIRQLRESGDANFLEPGSWEEELAAQCRTRLVRSSTSQHSVFDNIVLLGTYSLVYLFLFLLSCALGY